MSGGGNEAPAPVGSTTTANPAQQKQIDNLMGRAGEQYESAAAAPGAAPPSFAGPNDNIQGGWEGMQDYASGGGSGVSDAAQSGWGDLLNSMDVANNQQVQDQITQSNTQIADQFNQQVMPGISNNAVGAGQFGSSRQGIAEGQAASGAADAMASNATNIMSNAYETGSRNVQSAVNNAGNMWDLGARESMTQGQIGQDQAGWEQARLDDASQRWQSEQNRPWELLSMYQGLIQGNYGGVTTPNV